MGTATSSEEALVDEDIGASTGMARSAPHSVQAVVEYATVTASGLQ